MLGVPHAKLTAKSNLLLLSPLVHLAMKNECVLCIHCFINIVFIYIIFLFNTSYIHCPLERNVIAHIGMNNILLYCIVLPFGLFLQ